MRTMFWVVVCATAVLLVLNVPIGLLADKVGAARFLAVASVVFAWRAPSRTSP